MVSAGGHGDSHKKYLIHVPFHIKHHHHTHTIVKHVYHKAEKPEYKFLGYTHDDHHGGGSSGSSEGHGISFGGHSSGGDEHGGSSFGGEGGYGGHEEMSSHGWE